MARNERRDRVLGRSELYGRVREILRAMGGRSWECGGGLAVLVLQDHHLWQDQGRRK